MTDSPGPNLYLDPLLPVTVRRAPRRLPATANPGATSYLALAWEGEPDNPVPRAITGPATTGNRAAGDGDARRDPGVAGPHLPGRTASPLRTVAGPALIWSCPASTIRLGAVDGWFLAIGHRVLQDITVAFYGEPGLCRFLDDLQKPGWSPIAGLERDQIDSIANGLMDELDNRPPAYRARVRSLFSDLLLLIYRSTLQESADDHEGGYRLSDVVDYIEENYAQPLTLVDLAAVLACSPAYFSRLFSREIGVPPFEYINRVRVRHACALLRSTDRSITEIAFEVGYNNVSFFNRYFRRIMQRTPREYRRYVRS
jgi:AraC-like DNA-binding protein